MISTVLFVSVRNAGRTQMAAGWLKALAHPEKVRAVSAGTSPADALDLSVVAAMKEAGIDISSSVPRALTPELERSADMLIVIGPPLLEPPVRHEKECDEWFVVDPAWETLDRVRQIRGDVETMVRRLLVANHWMPFGASTPPST